MMLKEKTHALISSNRVEGTAVYGREDNHIGSVKELLIEKRGGQVQDVIVSVGGFLGLGSDLHSLPWSKLDYDVDLGGYKLDVTEEELKNAPRFAENDAERPYDRDYQTSVYEYWTVTPYW
ncbi:PRC-barrel domain-containing protein [Parasphingopyxis marina]|nr:PRC-barrel domain-containing protein [Parasphingopyxis marina]